MAGLYLVYAVRRNGDADDIRDKRDGRRDTRFAVSSPASLFNHEGSGHQLTINKNETADQSSILFQTGFSGRHEIVSDENDDFVFKISPDGTQFSEVLKIDSDTAETTIESLKFPDFWRWCEATTLVVKLPSGQNQFYLLNAAFYNLGSAYDTQTGVFTVPKTGLYLLNVSFNKVSDDPFNFDVEANGSAVARVQFFLNKYSHMSKVVCLTLEENDVLTLVATNNSSVRFDGGGAQDKVTLLPLGVL